MEKTQENQRAKSCAAGYADPSAADYVQAKSLMPPPFRVTSGVELQRKEETETPQQETMLQRIGNAGGFLPPPPNHPSRAINSVMQMKHTLGAPDDHYEREADSVADKVVSQINTPQVQQKNAAIQTQRTTPTITTLQRSGGNREGDVSDDISNNIESSRGGGSSMPSDIQTKMGDAMGADFSSVRIHNNSNADTLNRSVNARAFTTGQDIFFKQDEYNPSSSDGQRLLAHELTHVVQQNSGVVSRKVLQRDVDETKALPPNAFFKPKSMLWEQLSNQIKIISQGGSGMLPSVSNEFSLSMDNTNKFIEHAQSSHVYYVGKTPNKSQGGIVEDAKEFLGKALNGDTNGIKAKYCEADLNWGGNFLQELNVGNQNSSSWLNSVNSALDSYNDLVKKCKALNIEVYNAAPTGLQKAFNPNAIGEQKINTSDISGYGNTLYTLAKKGDAPMPDPTTYNNSIEEYNNARNSLSPKTRAITSLFIKVQKDTIDSKLKAKEEDKEKWEAYKKMVDAFATGISLAVGGELEGSSPAGVTMDSVTGDAQMTGTSKSLGAKDYTGYASKGVSFLLDAKIEKITKAINAYNTQIKVLTDISANQELIAKTEEHTNILRELRAKAKRMEDNEVDFQTRMSQWGVNIDKKLKEKKHDGAIPGEGAEITDLFIKIRVCKAKLKLVDLSSGMETAGIHNTMNNLTASTSALLAKIDGRQDGRTSFSRIESNRWASASSAIDSVNAVMASKSTHIGELETEFLSTFTKRGGAANSGTQIPSQY